MKKHCYTIALLGSLLLSTQNSQAIPAKVKKFIVIVLSLTTTTSSLINIYNCLPEKNPSQPKAYNGWGLSNCPPANCSYSICDCAKANCCSGVSNTEECVDWCNSPYYVTRVFIPRCPTKPTPQFVPSIISASLSTAAATSALFLMPNN